MAIEKKSGLGKGIGALFEMVETTDSNGVVEIDIKNIEPNMEQPRKYFDAEKISELADSIKKHGLIQPLIVTKEGNIYKIVAGERRWRASREAGLTKLPVVIKDITPKEFMELAIIENIQREDLNPLEEAEAYERLSKDYDMTQDEIAVSVGKSRPSITNAMRLLSLNGEIKKLIIDGSISAGHAKCLAGVKDEEIQKKVANMITSLSLNVRQTEECIKGLLSNKNETRKLKNKKDTKNVEIRYLESALREIFNTKVLVKDDNNKGKIEIEYYSAEERERIFDILRNRK